MKFKCEWRCESFFYLIDKDDKNPKRTSCRFILIKNCNKFLICKVQEKGPKSHKNNILMADHYTGKKTEQKCL